MFVEAVRLLVTLALLVAGFNIGRLSAGWFPNAGLDPGVTVIWGAVLGAGIGYVLGGVGGRALDRSIVKAPQTVSRASGAELFAGAFGLITGIIVGAVLSVPTIVLLPANIGWPVAGLIVLVLAAFGARVFAARSDDLLSATGLRRAARSVPGSDEHGERYLIDSSAAIDARVLDLMEAGLVKGNVWASAFVIDELQGIADAADANRRRRGRRGLDVLEAMRDVPGISFLVLEDTVPEHAEVDAKLLALAAKLDAALITTDHNLAKAGSVRGLRILNPHSIGESLRPEVAVGDLVEVMVEREGNEPGQGVAFLDDGTMVVVANGAGAIGMMATIEVTNTLRTSVGRMVFASLSSAHTS
ncbi:MAG: TRAM domain-containing protein [Acidimicrobiia bacterium]|nr:TRAM domain-containing protein [Acidimicrobiia bacterium]